MKPVRTLLTLILLLTAVHHARAATIEFLTGEKLECLVLSKDDSTVTIEVTQGDKKTKRTLPLAEIHTVTINGKRHVINERPAGAKAAGSRTTKSTKTTSGAKKAETAKDLRTRAEVDALISELGRKAPDWYEATPLNFPKTLDLTWPAKSPPGWDNQRNVGQYVWDVINPNQGKWHEGIRLMHHLLSVNKDQPETQRRVMLEIGRMYFILLEDYARAAFWYRQAGADKTFSGNTVHLAECYFRLGNRQMAFELLRGGTVNLGTVKLLAEMGDLPGALRIADQYVRGANPDLGHLVAADACRSAGKYPEAIAHYEKTLEIIKSGQAKGRAEHNKRRAEAGLDTIRLFELSDPTKVPDGKYQAESLGYEAAIRVEVTVKAGRIEGVKVVQHREKQFYSSLSDTPAKIIAKQGVKGVDATSGATITSEAIINATAKALAGAKK